MPIHNIQKLKLVPCCFFPYIGTPKKDRSIDPHAPYSMVMRAVTVTCHNRQASKERPSISRKAQRENKKMEMKLEAAIQAGFCWERKPKNFMFTLNGEFLRRLWWCNKVTAFSCAEHVFMDRSRIRRKSASATGKRYMSLGCRNCSTLKGL